MRVFYKTYGCTLNQADGMLAQSLLEQRGHPTTLLEEEADLVVVSTCAVKETTENKILSYLEGLQARGRKVVVSGCLPATSLARVKEAVPDALAFLGPNSIRQIPEILASGSRQGQRVQLQGRFSEKFGIERAWKGILAPIQVSSGCLSACTFCATKLVRGSFQSKPPERVVEEAGQALAGGAKEIQLASQDTGCYGFDLKTNVARLAGQVAQLEGRFRIRVGMGSPQHFAKFASELGEALRLPKAYKFLHVPVQSGSDEVLEAMGRNYTVEAVRRLLLQMKGEVPGLMLATDAIVGFPGETEVQFEQTLAFVQQMRFDVVNVSKFSKRPGTKAAQLQELPSQVKKERAARLSELALRISRENNRACIGKVYEDVLITERVKNGFLAGRNASYKTVLFADDDTREVGQFVRATVREANHTHLMAKE